MEILQLILSYIMDSRFQSRTCPFCCLRQTCKLYHKLLSQLPEYKHDLKSIDGLHPYVLGIWFASHCSTDQGSFFYFSIDGMLIVVGKNRVELFRRHVQ